MSGELDSWEEEEFNFEESINKKLGSSLTLDAGWDDLVVCHNSEGLLGYQRGGFGVLHGSSHGNSAQMSGTDRVSLFGSANNKSVTTKLFGEKVEKHGGQTLGGVGDASDVAKRGGVQSTATETDREMDGAFGRFVETGRLFVSDGEC
jgi:hypothetical protein